MAWNQSFYSYNNLTGHGNAVANTNPLYLMEAQVNYYDQDLNLINNDQFVTCQLVSQDPLTVKYTVNKNAKWSDGVPVDASDLMLSWAAQSGKYNTGELKTDDNGNPIPQPNVVAFDASSTGLALVKDTPTISDGGQSITLKYSTFFADYPIALTMGVPAHVIGMKALGAKDGASAKTAMNTAFQKDDKAALKKVADFYNTGFDFTELPSDKELYLSSGAYLLTDFKKDQYMTFKVNPDYNWGPKPSIQQITYRFIPDAMASVQALQNGEIDMTNPQATVDVLGAVNNLKNQGVDVINTIGSTYEHVDMAENNKGPFDPATYGGDKAKAQQVRAAFIKTIPRQNIVSRLIKPLNPTATTRDSFTLVPGSPGYDEMVQQNGSANWKDADIAGAKDLLAKAGVKTPVTVRFLFAKDNTRRQNEFKLIQQSAQQAGFTLVDASRTDWGAQLPNTKIYDASLFGWQSTNTGVTANCDNYKTKGQNNFYGYSSAALDAACVKLNAATTPEDQLKYLIEIEKALWSDSFGTVIFQFPEIVASNSKKLQNVKMIPLSPGPFWNFWEWTTTS
ncbi:peptide ABC transporter substrate-binding protein [Nakamurella endophytica]|uniref:Peptide ABC transporter substrate-binding protein n=1 Tax=Nakamurella endophytica TaxID=1748367 RepID=A0A917WB99_9ACTN|nr:peptide ABC transporter substrate-binding protein [Nakamurella endophytica]